MRKRNLLIYLVFIILSSLALFACSSHVSTSEHSVLRTGAFGGHYGINDDGVLIIDDDLVWFHDFETEEKVVVCNLPDCPHEPYDRRSNPDPICLATSPVGGRIETVGIYDGDIYMFVIGESDRTTIYQIDLEGSSRKELARFNTEISMLNNFEIRDGMAYFMTQKYTFDDEAKYAGTQLQYRAMSVDLRSGEVNQYGEVKVENYGDVRRFTKIGDKLYYYFSYHDPVAEEDVPEVIEGVIGEHHHYLYEVDINTNEERIVFDIHGSDDLLYHFDADHFYFLTEDETEFFKTDWELSESEELFTGESINILVILKDGFIYIDSQDVDDAYYYYNLESKETHSFTRSDNEFNIQTSFDDWVFFGIDREGGPGDLVMMKRDDYFAGETDYIYLRSQD